MSFKWFIIHQWKEFWRSSIWQRNVALNIFIGFLLFLLILDLLILGLFLTEILQKALPDQSPVYSLGSGLVYYFFADMLIRYLMQALPTFSVESYLHLPIKKSSIAHFVIGKSFLHILNYLPLLILIPFTLRAVIPENNALAGLAWLASAFFLILNNNLLATYLKRQLVSKPAIPGIFSLVLIGLAVLDYLGYISLSHYSALAFGLILKHPVLTLVPFGLMLMMYLINFFYLKAKMYPDEIIKAKTYQGGDMRSIKYLESLGLTGDLMALEIKLWLRHKRTKTMLYLLPIFLLYGLFFYPNPQYKDQDVFFVFVGVFISGGLMMNYLNYAFGYESNYFDGILTRKIDMERYIGAKYTLGVSITILCYVLTIPYVFFGWYILLINTVCFIFNIGVLSIVLLYLATFNKKRMDLSKGATFNYQGMGAMNWLVLIPAFLFPVIIYFIFGKIFNYYIGLAVLAGMGLIGLAFRKVFINMIFLNFQKRKYIMSDGFREG
jgi:hypothetical protein